MKLHLTYLTMFILSICLTTSRAQPIGKWIGVKPIKYEAPVPQTNSFFVFDSITAMFVLEDPATDLPRYLMWTSDGGLNWVRQNIDFPAFTLISPPDIDHLFLLSYEDTAITALYLSSDRGKSWEFLRKDTAKTAYNLVMFDATYGMRQYQLPADSNHHVELTTDGGKTFDQIVTDSLLYAMIDTADYLDTDHRYSYFFWRASETSAIGIGRRQGFFSRQVPFLFTSDRGATWETAFSPQWEDTTKVASIPNTTIGSSYIALPIGGGKASSLRPTFLYSTDEGASWQESLPFDTTIRRIAVTSPSNFWSFVNYPNASVIAYTSNGGAVWSQDSTTFKDIDLRNFVFTSSGHGFAYGYNRKSMDSLIYVFHYLGEQSSVEHATRARTIKSISYPNPGSNRITLWTRLPADKVKKLTVADAVGRVVYPIVEVHDSYVELDMSVLPDGAYSAVIQDGVRFLYFRFLAIHSS